TNRQTDLTYTPSFGGSGLYNRRLNDRGRNVFVNFSLHSSGNDRDQERILNTLMYAATAEEADSVYQQHLVNLRNKNLNGGASLSYIEPLGEASNLEFNYDYNFANYDNYRKANAYDDFGDVIANPQFNNEREYGYTFSTHRIGLTYRNRTDKLNYSIGAAVQPNLLDGDANIDGSEIRINRRGFNVIP